MMRLIFASCLIAALGGAVRLTESEPVFADDKKGDAANADDNKGCSGGCPTMMMMGGGCCDKKGYECNKEETAAHLASEALKRTVLGDEAKGRSMTDE